MRQTIAAIILASAAAMLMTSAKAADATIGGVAISLPTPSGFCEASPNHPSDNRLLTGIGASVEKSGNKLLGLSIDCQQLTDWRATKRKLLDDFAQYQTPIAAMDKLASQAAVKATCAEMRGQGEKIVADITPKAQADIEESFNKIKINELKSLGVLAEDPDACYMGLLQKIHTEVGTDKTQVILIADTVIKGKHIFIDQIARAAGPDTVANVLKLLKANVAALYAANK